MIDGFTAFAVGFAYRFHPNILARVRPKKTAGFTPPSPTADVISPGPHESPHCFETSRSSRQFQAFSTFFDAHRKKNPKKADFPRQVIDIRLDPI
jgi:hypothetical protein